MMAKAALIDRKLMKFWYLTAQPSKAEIPMIAPFAKAKDIG